MKYKAIKAIISGGGTGGHIFPALSIANKLKEVCPGSDILFVGAEGKMEMEKVPAAGYRIVGLPIVGLQRQLSAAHILNDLQVPGKIVASVRKAGRILSEFKPDIAIGVGGYASAPLIFAAQRKGIPTLLQEQNGFAGLTNKLLGRRAGRICVAYEGMERFFPADKILLTGNPIRKEMVPATPEMVREGLVLYHLTEGKKHLLIVGGSLGSRTLNRSVRQWISNGCPGGEDVEVIWQCGRFYKEGIDAFMQEHPGLDNIQYSEFIGRMDLAYAVADLIISRSGASSVSEICATHKAAVFVPSPNVAEDHQTHNAMALVRKDAGVIVRDDEAPEKLLGVAMELIHDPERIGRIERNVAKLAKMDAAQEIVDEVYKLID